MAAGSEEAVLEVLRSGQHAGGAVRAAFERDLCARIGVPHGVAVQSGHAALHLALVSLEVEPGDRVLVPSYVCAALLNAVAMTGASPVVADVHPRFMTLTPELARDALAREGLSEVDVKAAIVPHIIGYPAPLHLWDLEIPVVEDCAMALGAQINNEEVGSFGDVSVFSFYATKMISSAQGGMVLTADESRAYEMRDRIAYDNRDSWKPRYNYPLADLNAALGRAQLADLSSYVNDREQIATVYRTLMRRLHLDTADIYPETRPCYMRFPVYCPDQAARDRTRRDLAAAGIESKPAVFEPLHRYLGLDPEHFPGTEEVQQRALSVPIYPSLSEQELDYVCEALVRSLGE